MAIGWRLTTARSFHARSKPSWTAALWYRRTMSSKYRHRGTVPCGPPVIGGGLLESGRTFSARRREEDSRERLPHSKVVKALKWLYSRSSAGPTGEFPWQTYRKLGSRFTCNKNHWK